MMEENKQETTGQVAAPPAPSKAAPGKARKRRKKRIKTAIALILIIAILGGGGFALYRFLFTTEQKVGEIYAVPAEIGSITSSASGSGSARAKENAAITLSAGGTVEEVFVTAGEMVFAGQPLYTINSQAAQDAVTAAQETVTAAQELVARLQQDLADLYESMNDLVVTAPFTGKLQNVGDFTVGTDVTGNSHVCTLVNDQVLKMSLYYSYGYEDSIYVGQAVQVSVPAVMSFYEGTVERINKVEFISPEGGTFFEVVVTLRNPGALTEDMAATATITGADGSDIYPYGNGTLQFYERRELMLKVGGPVLSVNLLNYAKVTEGQVLLSVGDTDISERIRAKQDEINAAQQDVELAQEKVLEATQALDNFNAVAPIDGTIITCTLSEGAEVRAGDTVIIISNTATMLVDITVDDRNITFIRPGDYVELTWNGMPFQGLVTSIDMGNAQQGSGMTRYPVRLEVDNWDGSLWDGAWLQYSFVTSQSDECILVPSSAVRYFSDADGNRQSVVFVQRDSRPDDVPELDLPERQPSPYESPKYPSEEEGYYPVIVETGLANNQSVEIKSGIELGDMVFVSYTVMDSSWG